MKPSREIRDCVLGIYHDMAEGEVPRPLSMSPDAAFIGTGQGEVWLGGEAIRTAIRTQNDELGLVKLVPGTIRAYEEGTVGWAFDEATIFLPDGRPVPTRLTFVFHREDGEWRVIHGHASNVSDNLEYWGADIDLSMDRIATLVKDERPDLGSLTSTEGTVTIMFTDIESSTALNEVLGDDRWLVVLREHDALVRERTERSGGRVIKSQGDGFMLAFPSARRAVECAMEIQRDLSGPHSTDIPIRVRMGLHTGEPVREAEDFFGRDVAYAARVGAAANGTEILVSSLVMQLCAGTSFTFDGPRELEFKGFEGAQAVYAVAWS